MAENSKTHLSESASLPRAEALVAMARQVVEGSPSGSPRGSFKEYAREFTGHRENRFADGLRQRDKWTPSRKTASFSSSLADDSVPPVHLVIDGSESMKFGSTECTKFEYAQNLAACLAFAILRQKETVQISFFNEKFRTSIPPASDMESFLGMMEKMAAWEASGSTHIGTSIREYSETLGAAGTVILLSDFFEDEETWTEAVELLRFQGREVLLVQIMDTQEIEFPFAENIEFEGMEGQENLIVETTEVRDAYLEEVRKLFRRLGEISSRCGSHYLLGDTSKPLAEVLESTFLSRRQARFV